jgi:NADH-quinone oxidoreductase subunit F
VLIIYIASATVNRLSVESKIIDIKGITDKIVKSYGKEERYVIPILQSLQNELNYLPEEALKRVCATTKIKPSEIVSVATFYSNFRLEEVGKHIVKVCVGTACHIKGAQQVYDAFKRHFGIDEANHTDPKGLFTIEQVACLGCCTIAPVVQINGRTYGHTSPENISEIVDDFLDKKFNSVARGHEIDNIKEQVYQGEIRIGLGSCCVASGSSDVQRALSETIRKTGIHVNVKHVGCIGMCHQVPLLEIQKPGKGASFYNKVRPGDIRDILLTHFQPVGPVKKIKNGIYAFFDTLLDHDLEDKEAFSLKDNHISPFLKKQMHIATECYGELKPLDFEEYQLNHGFIALP